MMAQSWLSDRGADFNRRPGLALLVTSLAGVFGRVGTPGRLVASLVERSDFKSSKPEEVLDLTSSMPERVNEEPRLYIGRPASASGLIQSSEHLQANALHQEGKPLLGTVKTAAHFPNLLPVFECPPNP